METERFNKAFHINGIRKVDTSKSTTESRWKTWKDMVITSQAMRRNKKDRRIEEREMNKSFTSEAEKDAGAKPRPKMDTYARVVFALHCTHRKEMSWK